MMKKVMGGAAAILVLFLLITIACCPAGNEHPTAHIDSIDPSLATEGETVTFTGHGVDRDGNVVGWRWTSDIDGVIGTNASFTTSALSVGTHNISFIVQDNNDAWSDEVIDQITIEAAMGMEDAIIVVLEEILPAIPEVSEGNPYWCLKLDSILQEGTRIEEDGPGTVSIILEKDTFFFYLDLAPGTYYAHPVKYLLVDNEGNHEEMDAEWWPRIDDVIPEGLVKAIPDEDDVVDTNIELTQPSGTPMVFQFPTLNLLLCEGFIVVQGLMPGEPLYNNCKDDYNNVINFFTAYANECSQVEGLTESDAADVINKIEDMVTDGLDVITIYITAHGDTDYIRLGGGDFWAEDFRGTMEEHSGVTFNFILNSCHSGSFIDNLNTLNNVRIVVTACRHDELAWADHDIWEGQIDFNSADTGSEWTSSLLEAMSQIVEVEARFNDIIFMAEGEGVPETCVLICQGYSAALGMNPTFSLNQDLDFSHRMGWSLPRGYCGYE